MTFRPWHRCISVLRFLLVLAFLYCGTAIILRAFIRPELSKAIFHLESAAAVAFVGCIQLAARGSQTTLCCAPSKRWLPSCLPILSFFPYLLAVQAPLLFDSYTHVVVASTQRLLASIVTVYDFRPLGYFDYWIEYRWARFHSTLWHVDGIVLHIAAVYLLWVLCRRLGLSLWASSIAAFFFGIHGANPETVFWTATRFDELATIFVLLALLLAWQYAGERKRYGFMLVSCLLAVLSKESAYCLPGLAACTFWYGNRWNRAAMKAIAGLTTICALVFAYRYWLLGGIGGYLDANGRPAILHFNLLRTVEILFLKIWGVLFFPINWSIAPEKWLGIALAAFIAAAILAVAQSKPTAHTIAASATFCIIAILPAAHLASLDARIIGSRVFHLATIGLALMVGALFDSFSSKWAAVAMATGFLVFQCAALVHNLLIWRDTAYLAQHACITAAELAGTQRSVVVTSLPATHDGVFFLSNGFSDCVYVNTGTRLEISSSNAKTGNEPVFYWDEHSQSIKKK